MSTRPQGLTNQIHVRIWILSKQDQDEEQVTIHMQKYGTVSCSHGILAKMSLVWPPASWLPLSGIVS